MSASIDIPYAYAREFRLKPGVTTRKRWIYMDADADFAWESLAISYCTRDFGIQFLDSAGQPLFSMAEPPLFSMAEPIWRMAEPIWPTIVIPAGGRVGVRLMDYGKRKRSPNDIMIALQGFKRYAVDREPVVTLGLDRPPQSRARDKKEHE